MANRRSRRRIPDEENPWYQEKKKHESEVDIRAKQISTSMAKLAFENSNTVVFSISIEDGKTRKIVESIENEIRSTGLNFLKLEGQWDINSNKDKDRYVLEKTDNDFEKTHVDDDSWGNRMLLGQPFIFGSIFEDDDDGGLTNQRWKQQNLTLYNLLGVEEKWETSSGCFDTSVQVRSEDSSMKSIELDPTRIYDDYGNETNYLLYPLMLFSNTELRAYYEQAIFIVDPHLNFEYFNALQPKPKSVINEGYNDHVSFNGHRSSYNYEDYEDIIED